MAMAASAAWVEGAGAEDACEAARKACADQARPGPYYQLVAMTPRPNSVAPEWKLSIDAGRIVMENQFGRSVCAWEPASVDRIYSEGFDISIEATATSTSQNNSVGGFIQLNQGFGPNGDLGPKNWVDVRAKYGETVTDSQRLHIDPRLPNAFAKVGDRVSIDIGGCEAGTMTYTYEYRE